MKSIMYNIIHWELNYSFAKVEKETKTMIAPNCPVYARRSKRV